MLQQASAAQPGTQTGRVMGVEQTQENVGRAVVNVEHINLWCADGMRSVKLSEIQREQNEFEAVLNAFSAE